MREAGHTYAEIGRAFGVSRTRATQLVAREELRRKASFDPQVTPRLPDSRIRSRDTPEYRPCLIGLLPSWSLHFPMPTWSVPQPAFWVLGSPPSVAPYPWVAPFYRSARIWQRLRRV